MARVVKKHADEHLISVRRSICPSRPFQWRSHRRVSLQRTWQKGSVTGRDSKLRLRVMAIKGILRELTWLGQPRIEHFPFAFPLPPFDFDSAIHFLLSTWTTISSFWAWYPLFLHINPLIRMLPTLPCTPQLRVRPLLCTLMTPTVPS